jgi:hypothetical protein
MHVSGSSICLTFGLVQLGLGIWQRIQELSPRTWPQVSGTIVTSWIDRSRRDEMVPIVEYEYCYGGQKFRSSRRSAANFTSGSPGAAKSVTSRYPVGCNVTVFVNPKKPAKSSLEYGNTTLSWILIVLGLVFTALALVFPDGFQRSVGYATRPGFRFENYGW